MNIPKIFADFNNADQQGRVRLTTNGSLADIRRLNLELKDGMQVFLDDDEGLTTIGYLKYSDDEKIWVVQIDWDNLQHRNE